MSIVPLARPPSLDSWSLLLSGLLCHDLGVSLLSNEEIARSLGIGVETVKEQAQKMLRKLKLPDRTAAAVLAVREGLV